MAAARLNTRHQQHRPHRYEIQEFVWELNDRMMTIILSLLFCAGAAFKLVNFGRYCWGKGNKRGAIGLWLYALVTVALPAALFMRG